VTRSRDDEDDKEAVANRRASSPLFVRCYP
jgi:hypothetical protein